MRVKSVEITKGHLSQEVEVGELRPADGRWYVGFVEFGSRDIPAQPFIRPSIRIKLPEMIRIVEASLPSK